MKQIKILSGYFLVFILGAVLSAYVTIRYHMLFMLEDISIRSNSMEVFKAVSTLELLKNNKVQAAEDFLEWQIDEGLMGLSRYTSSPRMQARLDDFSVSTLQKSREYRQLYPRESGFKETDKIIGTILNSEVSIRKGSLSSPITIKQQ